MESEGIGMEQIGMEWKRREWNGKERNGKEGNGMERKGEMISWSLEEQGTQERRKEKKEEAMS